jgi:hypothetical protein
MNSLYSSVHILACFLLGQSSQGQAAPVVLADVAHAASAATHTVLDRAPTGYSQLWAVFSRRPCMAKVNRGPLSSATLADVSTVVVTVLAPDKPLSPDEVQSLKKFVESGGTLLLVNGDLAPPAMGTWNKLAGEFGIQSHGGVTRLTAPQGPSTHISRYSGAGLARWLRGLEDAQLYCQTSSAGPKGGEVLVSYDGTAFAAVQPAGRGRVYVFGGDMLSNAYTSAKAAAAPSETPAANVRLLDALIDELLAPAHKPETAKP